MRIWLLLVVFCAACGPKCLRGHDETKLIPAHDYEDVSYVHIGDTSIPMYHTRHVPDTYENRFVCDQYEAQK